MFHIHHLAWLARVFILLISSKSTKRGWGAKCGVHRRRERVNIGSKKGQEYDVRRALGGGTLPWTSDMGGEVVLITAEEAKERVNNLGD